MAIIVANTGVFVFAFKEAKIWNDNGMNLKISFNISLKQIQYQNILKDIDDALQETSCKPEYIIAEITESVMIEDIDTISELLLRIKQRGIKIALDDFGTGYSSYSNVKKLPYDIIKVDKSLIDNIPQNEEDVAIVQSILSMAKSLHYEVLFEGVETISQRDRLKELGCDYYQGYLYSKPLNSIDFEKYHKSRIR